MKATRRKLNRIGNAAMFALVRGAATAIGSTIVTVAVWWVLAH